MQNFRYRDHLCWLAADLQVKCREEAVLLVYAIQEQDRQAHDLAKRRAGL